MNIIEAMMELQEGNKITRSGWIEGGLISKNYFITRAENSHLLENLYVKDADKWLVAPIVFSDTDILAIDWVVA